MILQGKPAIWTAQTTITTPETSRRSHEFYVEMKELSESEVFLTVFDARCSPKHWHKANTDYYLHTKKRDLRLRKYSKTNFCFTGGWLIKDVEVGTICRLHSKKYRLEGIGYKIYQYRFTYSKADWYDKEI
jgi:hypothetical protein